NGTGTVTVNYVGDNSGSMPLPPNEKLDLGSTLRSLTFSLDSPQAVYTLITNATFAKITGGASSAATSVLLKMAAAAGLPALVEPHAAQDAEPRPFPPNRVAYAKFERTDKKPMFPMLHDVHLEKEPGSEP